MGDYYERNQGQGGLAETQQKIALLEKALMEKAVEPPITDVRLIILYATRLNDDKGKVAAELREAFRAGFELLRIDVVGGNINSSTAEIFVYFMVKRG